jgi:hypothetical protein
MLARLAIFNALVANLEEQPLHRVHRRGLLGSNREERGIEVANVLLEKVAMFDSNLIGSSSVKAPFAFLVWRL